MPAAARVAAALPPGRRVCVALTHARVPRLAARPKLVARPVAPVTRASVTAGAAAAPASRAPEFTTKLFTKEAVSIAGETECAPARRGALAGRAVPQ